MLGEATELQQATKSAPRIYTNCGGMSTRPRRAAATKADARLQAAGANHELEEHEDAGVNRERDSSLDDDIANARGGNHPRRWSSEEDDRLRRAVDKHQGTNWKDIAADVMTRNHVQCLQRWKKVLIPGLVKGQWSREEDLRLTSLVKEGHKNWGVLATHMPGRTSKQCRERWCHHLDPAIVKGDWTPEEDNIVMSMHAKIGNKWSTIAQHLNGRTENATKVRWKILERNVKRGHKNLQEQTARTTAVRRGTEKQLRHLAAKAAASVMSKSNQPGSRTSNGVALPKKSASSQATSSVKGDRRSGVHQDRIESTQQTSPDGKLHVPSRQFKHHPSAASTNADEESLPKERLGSSKRKRVDNRHSKNGHAWRLPGDEFGGNSADESRRRRSATRREWSVEEDARLRKAVEKIGEKNWRQAAVIVRTRTHVQCQQRWKKALRPGLVKGAWSTEEDVKLMALIAEGFENWSVLASNVEGRTAKQCRERWCHHLDPSINHGGWSHEEDQLLLSLQTELGNKWSAIARKISGRTEHTVKGRFKTLSRNRSRNDNSGARDISDPGGGLADDGGTRTSQANRVGQGKSGVLRNQKRMCPLTAGTTPTPLDARESLRRPYEVEEQANLPGNIEQEGVSETIYPAPTSEKTNLSSSLEWDGSADHSKGSGEDVGQQQLSTSRFEQHNLDKNIDSLQIDYSNARTQRTNGHEKVVFPSLVIQQPILDQIGKATDQGHALSPSTEQAAQQQAQQQQPLESSQQLAAHQHLHPAVLKSLGDGKANKRLMQLRLQRSNKHIPAGQDDPLSIARLLSISSGDVDSQMEVDSGFCGGAEASGSIACTNGTSTKMSSSVTECSTDAASSPKSSLVAASPFAQPAPRGVRISPSLQARQQHQQQQPSVQAYPSHPNVGEMTHSEVAPSEQPSESLALRGLSVDPSEPGSGFLNPSSGPHPADKGDGATWPVLDLSTTGLGSSGMGVDVLDAGALATRSVPGGVGLGSANVVELPPSALASSTFGVNGSSMSCNTSLGSVNSSACNSITHSSISDPNSRTPALHTSTARPSPGDYAMLASCFTDGFDRTQDSNGKGCGPVTLGGDPYCDYSLPRTEEILQHHSIFAAIEPLTDGALGSQRVHLNRRTRDVVDDESLMSGEGLDNAMPTDQIEELAANVFDGDPASDPYFY